MISIENVTIEQLKFRRIGHSISCGEHKYHGRMIKDTKFIEEYETTVGRFLQEEWVKIAKTAVLKNGLTDLYEEVFKYCQTHCAWLKTEEQITEHALSCMATHAYEYWDDFKIKKKSEPDTQGIQMELSDFII